MGKLLIFLGIVLIFGSIIFMGLVFGIAGEDTSAQIITPFACEGSETLTQVQRALPSFEGSGTTIDFYCEDSEGDERNVTGAAVMVIIIGFTGLLLSGILAIFVGAAMISKNVVKNITGDFLADRTIGVQSATIDLRNGSFQQGQLSPELQNIMRQASGQLNQASGGDSLSAKLKQLDDAYEQRLISREEYDKARTAILDKMDD